MFFAEIITLTGDLGSGKGTSAKLLEKKLGYDYFSIGSLQRAMAEERDMGVLEFNQLSLVDPSIDKALDARLKEFNQRNKLIIDGRMAFYFIPQSFKVYLRVDPRVAAERIFKDKVRKGEERTSIEETLSKNQERKKIETMRYEKIYGVNVDDLTHYDFILDTTHLRPEEVSEKIIQAYQGHLKKEKIKKSLILFILALSIIGILVYIYKK